MLKRRKFIFKTYGAKSLKIKTFFFKQVFDLILIFYDFYFCCCCSFYTAISVKVVGSSQAYVTRLKGSVGSCKSVLVLRLSAVGQELQISWCK